jgi:hypothetical protein
MSLTNTGRPFALRLNAPKLEPLERALLRLLLQEDSLTHDPHLVNSLPPDLRAVLETMEPNVRQGARARSRRRRLLARAQALGQRASRNVPSNTQRRVPTSGVVKCQNGSR